MDVPILDMVLFYVVLLVSLVFHEAAHALVAMWGGDRTAYVGGQVTLNPIPHIKREPFGMVILPIAVLVFGASRGSLMCMGFASTPISVAWAARHPNRAALMSLAGPVSNFLLAGLGVLVLKGLVAADYATSYPGNGGSMTLFISPNFEYSSGPVFATAKICTVFVILNAFLGILNLIPWPPLDGAGVLGGFFPRTIGRFYENVRSQTFLMVGGILALFYLMPSLIRPVVAWLHDVI